MGWGWAWASRGCGLAIVVMYSFLSCTAVACEQSCSQCSGKRLGAHVLTNLALGNLFSLLRGCESLLSGRAG